MYTSIRICSRNKNVRTMWVGGWEWARLIIACGLKLDPTPTPPPRFYATKAIPNGWLILWRSIPKCILKLYVWRLQGLWSALPLTSMLCGSGWKKRPLLQHPSWAGVSTCGPGFYWHRPKQTSMHWRSGEEKGPLLYCGQTDCGIQATLGTNFWGFWYAVYV